MVIITVSLSVMSPRSTFVQVAESAAKAETGNRLKAMTSAISNAEILLRKLVFMCVPPF